MSSKERRFLLSNSNSTNSHIWWQHYTNSLSMALGKKSFLIRDILECQGQSGAIPSLPSNPRLIEWIIQSRLEQFNQSSLWSRDHSVEVDRDGPSSSAIEGNSLPCDSPDLNPNVAISPLIHNWLSINRFANRVTAPNHPYMSCPQAEKFPMRSMTPLPSHLYQNLYYYAIQQQINASLVGKSSVNEESCPSPSQQQAQQSILKNVKGKANSSRLRRPPSMINSLARKRINSKAKKPNNKGIKKVVHVESNQLTINEQSDNQYETGLDLTQNGDNKHWEAECNCDEDDDNEEDTGANKCAAKSKCKKLRRNRTVFTELQLMGLERRFDSQKYLSTPDRADLARALGLTQLQVKTWYQNRRMKWKKQVMQNGCPYPPTKPKGRPKKDSIPTYGMEFTNSILCPIFASHGNGTGQPSTNATTTLVSFTHNLTTSNVDSPLQ